VKKDVVTACFKQPSEDKKNLHKKKIRDMESGKGMNSTARKPTNKTIKRDEKTREWKTGKGGGYKKKKEMDT